MESETLRSVGGTAFIALFLLLIVILYPSVVYYDELLGACHTLKSYHDTRFDASHIFMGHNQEVIFCFVEFSALIFYNLLPQIQLSDKARLKINILYLHMTKIEKSF